MTNIRPIADGQYSDLSLRHEETLDRHGQISDDASVLADQVPDETYGSGVDVAVYSPDQTSQILNRAFQFLSDIEQEQIATQSHDLILGLGGAITAAATILDVDTMVPLLRPMQHDDGSVIFEWIQPNFRIGFNIEMDASESGWYLISNPELGDIAASGFINIQDVSKLQLWLIMFLFLNSE